MSSKLTSSCRAICHPNLRHSLLVILTITLVLFGTACNSVKTSSTPSVFVSIPPQAFFVEQIAGTSVEINILVGPGQSPATYDPTPQQMARLANADILFTVGVPFEQHLLDKIKSGFKNLEIVNTYNKIKLRPINHNHEHEATGLNDPHIWLDPSLVKIQSKTICKALCRLMPDHKKTFEDNLTKFNQRLDSITADIHRKLSSLEKRTIYVFHPSYGYFCDAFDLKQVTIEKRGKEPSAQQLSSIVDRCLENSVNVIFVQPQFSQKSAKAIAKTIDGNIVPLDPLARDYFNNLNDMAEKIAAALSEKNINTTKPKTLSEGQ
ncbi:MAG: zinc ABC transporter substrate-binding protein [candidate division Zixibacteria bacterium]|nr:zinc ABC transporter substrate-binding protein [candidate division Zixibacteria bacterium]